MVNHLNCLHCNSAKLRRQSIQLDVKKITKEIRDSHVELRCVQQAAGGGGPYTETTSHSCATGALPPPPPRNSSPRMSNETVGRRPMVPVFTSCSMLAKRLVTRPIADATASVRRRSAADRRTDDSGGSGAAWKGDCRQTAGWPALPPTETVALCRSVHGPDQ
jgi:hypothetical protein